MSNDCIFCKITSKEIPATIVYEDDDIIAFDDIDPKAPVHCVVIPKKHIETLNDLNEESSSLAGSMFLAIKDIAKSKGVDQTGYRVVANCNKDAGQEVFHIHFHLIGGRAMTWPPG